MRAAALAVTLCAVAPRAAWAHGTFHELIAAADQRVAREHGAEAYLARGELYRTHGDFDAALADFGEAARLAPADGRVDLARGRALVDAHRPLQAKSYLDRYLTQHPESGSGFAARGRALAALGDLRGAARDWESAVVRFPQPTPDDYVARMTAQSAAGDREAALRGLDEAIARLGPVVSLELPAIDLELEARRYDAALARLARVAAQSPRKESWLARRGDILLAAGRRDEAARAFRGALDAVAALPPGLRATRAAADVEEAARKGLAITAAPPARAGRAPRR